MGTGLEANAAGSLLELGIFVEPWRSIVNCAVALNVVLVGRGRFELPTKGLKVLCSTG